MTPARQRRGIHRHCAVCAMLAVLAALATSLSVVWAQDAVSVTDPVEPPPSDEVQTAASYLATARQSFNERKFSDAAEALRRAYALEPKPIYLFNAGTAYRKGEKLALALEMYKRYVEVLPEGALASEARAYIKDLTALLDAQRRLEANSQALQGANQLLENERSQAQQMQLALQLETKRAEHTQRELEKARKKPWHKRTPFIVVSTAVVGLGVILGITAIAISQSGQTEGGTHSVSF